MSTYSLRRDLAIFLVAAVLLVAGAAGAYQIADVRHVQKPHKVAAKLVYQPPPKNTSASTTGAPTTPSYPSYSYYYPVSTRAS